MIDELEKLVLPTFRKSVLRERILGIPIWKVVLHYLMQIQRRFLSLIFILYHLRNRLIGRSHGQIDYYGKSQ